MSSRSAARTTWGLVVVMVCGVLLSVSSSSQAETAPTSTVELEIKGMSCNSCAQTIKAELEGVEGVVKADVSFDRSNAVVQYRPAKVEPAQLVRKIRRIGYRAKIKKQG